MLPWHNYVMQPLCINTRACGLLQSNEAAALVAAEGLAREVDAAVPRGGKGTATSAASESPYMFGISTSATSTAPTPSITVDASSCAAATTGSTLAFTFGAASSAAAMPGANTPALGVGWSDTFLKVGDACCIIIELPRSLLDL